MKRILKKYPNMDKLIRLIKYMLKKNNINKTIENGLNSYMLYNLVYIFFYQFKINNLFQDFSKIKLGTLFYEFFDFWTNFDYKSKGVKIGDPIEFFDKSDDSIEYVMNHKFELFYEKMLVILEYNDTLLNVIRIKTDIPKIFEYFSKIKDHLKKLSNDNMKINILDNLFRISSQKKQNEIL